MLVSLKKAPVVISFPADERVKATVARLTPAEVYSVGKILDSCKTKTLEVVDGKPALDGRGRPVYREEYDIPPSEMQHIMAQFLKALEGLTIDEKGTPFPPLSFDPQTGKMLPESEASLEVLLTPDFSYETVQNGETIRRPWSIDLLKAAQGEGDTEKKGSPAR